MNLCGSGFVSSIFLGASLRDHGLRKDGQAEMLPTPVMTCHDVSCDVSFDDF